jgi:hypothetical protein
MEGGGMRKIRFRDIAVGTHFWFESEGGIYLKAAGRKLMWQGARGPWIKVTPRSYRHVEARASDPSHTVGTGKTSVVLNDPMEWTANRALGPGWKKTKYKPGDRVVIMNVDEYGMLGRDHHPQKSDEGLRALVKVVERESDYNPVSSDEDFELLTVETIEKMPRVLELVEYEVEWTGESGHGGR